MNRFIGISEASKILGVSISTLRRWGREGRLHPSRTKAGHRRYDSYELAELQGGKRKPAEQIEKRTIGYARVSSRDQKADLERQKQVLELFCAQHGWTFEIISDLGSGMNYRKKGLNHLLHLLLSGEIDRLVITHKDRLLRFGAELIFSVCEMKSVEVVILNRGEDSSFEEDLAKDVLEIITVFSARLYGSRSKKNQKLLDGMREVIQAAEDK